MKTEIYKAVIPARGAGTRMRKADPSAQLNAAQSATADSGVKAMIPFGRPFLDFVLSGLADAGYREACLVIGPEHGAVREYYEREAPPRRIRVSFAIQPEPRGSADALLAAESFVGNEEFLVLNSDNYYPASALKGLRQLGEPGTPLFEASALVRNGNISTERISSYALCEVDEQGYLLSVVEKPKGRLEPGRLTDQLVSMNIWRFSPQIFEACRHTPVSSRGEVEIPGAVQTAIDRFGMRFKVIRCGEGVLDLSYRGDIATVAERLRGIEPNP